MDARQFIDLVGAGQAAEARDALSELLAAQAYASLEAKKQEIATTLFNGKVEEPVETKEEPAPTE